MNAVEDQFTYDLRLAREICLGLAAFVITPSGEIRMDQLQDNARRDSSRRIELLARDSLSHPSARSGGLFWNAKVVPGADASDDSLACVAIGLEQDGIWLGLLGVVDSWLPELDAEQRANITALASSVSRLLASAGAAALPALTPPPAWPGAATKTDGDDDGDGDGDETRIADDAPDAGQFASPGQSDAGPSEPPTAVLGSEGFLGEVAEHLPDALVVAQDDGTIIYANQQFSVVTGLSPDVVLGGDIATLFSGDDPLSSATTWAEGAASLFGSPAPGRRLSVASADDKYVAVDAWGASMQSAVAGACHIGLIRAAEDSEASSAGPTVTDHGFVELLDALDEGILVCDARGIVLVANRSARTLHGLDPAESLIGKAYPKTSGLLFPEGGSVSGPDHPLERALRGLAVQGEQLLLDRGEGDQRNIAASARPLAVAEGEEPGALLVLRDTTPQVQSEAWLTHLAMHDALTGLANRHLFMDHLRRMLGQTGTRGGAVSIVYLDLDDFKGVNDEHGHEVGDEVLVTVARRVLGVVRPTDVVARLGGDEFVIAHTSRAGSDSVEALIARVRMSLAAPFRVHEHLLAVSASVGYVSTTLDDDPLSLLVRADREMFRRKKAARAEAEKGSRGR